MVNKITIWSVLEPLMYSKEFIHLAEISRELKSPHATVRKYLNELEKQGVVAKQIKGRMTMYKLNYASSLLTESLVMAEKNRLIKRCGENLVLKEIASFLHENSPGEAVIFGSMVDNAKKANDIDVLLTGKIDFRERIKEFEKKTGMGVHMINVKSLEEASPALKEEIIKKHLIIENSEKVIKWMLKN